MTPQLPKGYQRRLDSFNAFAWATAGVPTVRLRWSPSEVRWRFEQQVRRPYAALDERTAAHFKAGQASPETVQCYKDGYFYLWGYTPCLTEEGFPWSTGVERHGLVNIDRLITTLQWNIAELMGRTGNVTRDAQQLGDAADARSDAKEALVKRKRLQAEDDLAADMVNDGQWLEHTRIAVP